MSQASLNDREFVANLVEQHAPLIRNRIRRSLSGPVRRLFDSQDVLSTLRRRVDLMAANGAIRAQNEHQFLALLMKMMERAVIDKSRLAQRLRESPNGDPEWSFEAPSDKSDSELSEGVAEAMASLEADDRLVLSLWLEGMSQHQISESIGCTPGSVAHRWRRIKGQLRETLDHKAGERSS